MEREQRRRRARRRRRLRRIRQWLAALLALALIALLCIAGWRLFAGRSGRVRVTVGYEDWVRRYAGENGLEPAYVAAVIMAESSYRPGAVSDAGAQGLMQLIPETGQDMAAALGEAYEEGMLLDPETNIRYGSRYLGQLMRRYGGDMATASAAYFQGPGTVDRWLKDAARSADGRTLDDLGTSATETYVGRILKYYEEYRKIYA